jgi:hypothetical protein
MTNVQVRDVPESVLTLLKRDAVRNGLSLQRYLQDLLAAQAAVIRNNEILDRIAARLDGLPEAEDDVVEIIGQGRGERDAVLGLTE